MKIKKLRLSKNMTQLQLAKMIGVKRTTITMWENGKSFPPVETLKKLTKIFNCKIEDLI